MAQAIPHQGQIDMLRRDPSMADSFDGMFGAGTAAEYLAEPVEIQEQVTQELPTEGEGEQTAPQARPTQDPNDEPEGEGEDRNIVADVAIGAARGVVNFAENTADLVSMGAEALTGYAQFQWGDDGFELMTREEYNDAGGGAIFGKIGEQDNFLPEPDTMAGQIVQGITQFLTGFIPGGFALKAAGLTNKALSGFGGIARIAAADAGSSFIGFDGQEERMSNLIQSFPLLANPLTEALEANETDGEIEGRLKNVMEGLGLGAIIGSVVKIVKHVRVSRKVRAEKGKKAADQYVKDNSPELGKEGEALAEELVTGKPRKPGEFVAHRTPKAKGKGAVGQPTAAVLRGIKSVNVKKLVDDMIDSDGNITFRGDSDVVNWEKFNIEDDGKGIIEMIATELKGTSAWSNSVQKLEAVQTGSVKLLADMVDGDAGKMLSFALRESPDMEKRVLEFHAKKQLVASLANAISVRTKKLDAGGGSDKDRAILVGMMENHVALTAIIKGFGKSSARITSAGRIKVGAALSDEDIVRALENQDNLPKMIKMLAHANGNPKAVAKLLKMNRWQKAMAINNEMWMGALLSRPSTHAINMVSNTVQMFYLPSERALGAMLRGDANGVAESLRTYLGMRYAVRESMRHTWRSLKSADAILDPTHRTIERPTSAFSREGEGVISASVNFIGKVFRAPMRILGAGDEWAKQMNYRSDLWARNYTKGLQKGFEGQKLKDFVDVEMKAGFDDLGRATDQESLRYAREASFTEELPEGTISRAIQNTVNKHPVLKNVMPFIRTPINILKWTARRTPALAAITKKNRDAIAGGGRLASEFWGRQATGVVLYASGIALVSEGKITGSGPRGNPSEIKIMMEAGWRPYSYVSVDPVTGKKTWTSFNRMDPFATFFGLVADFAEISEHSTDDTSQLEIAASIITALAENITSKSYLRGLAEVVEVMNADDSDSWKVEKFLQNRAASYLGGAKEWTELFGLTDDPYMREVNSLNETLRRRIPWMSQDLPAKKSWLTGEAVRRDDGFLLWDDMAFSKTVDETENETLQTLMELGYGFSPPARKIEGVELSTAQWSRLHELTAKPTGKTPLLIDTLAKVLGSKQLRDLGPLPEKWSEEIESDLRVIAVKRVISGYKRHARAMLLQENSALSAAVTQQRQTKADVNRRKATDLIPIGTASEVEAQRLLML